MPWIEDVAADPPTSKNSGAAATGVPMATIAANMTPLAVVRYTLLPTALIAETCVSI